MLTDADKARGARYRTARKGARFTQTTLAEAITKLVKKTSGSTTRSATQQAIAAVEAGTTKNPWFRKEWAELTGSKEAWLEFGLEDLDRLNQAGVSLAIEAGDLHPDQMEMLKAMVRAFKEQNK
jgi:transcriptional regulator with XRE-family HTH domain